MSKERLVPRDLLNPTKKDPEFRSIFQHIQSAQLCRSPSELFAQHIVSIVHYIKGRVWSVPRLHRLKLTTGRQEFGWIFHYLLVTTDGAAVYGIIVSCSLFAAQHFHSSDMTLSERFAMYQRKAAEVEMMKPRKSPEIHRYLKRLIIWSGVINSTFIPPCSLFLIIAYWHQGCFSSLRRIDVSPSAFKRHSHLFEDMEETSYKVTSPFEIWRIWNKQIWDDPQQQCSALCFSFKGCVFLNQKSPIVFCKCQASPPAYEIWLLIGYVRTQAKG